MWIRTAFALIGSSMIVAAVTSSIGCYDETRHSPNASATITWTLQGQSNPLVCSRFGASDVEIRVVDASGKVAADLTTPCRAFRAVVALDAGQYRAELILLDDAGRPISEMAGTKPFRVNAESRVIQAVRFPGCPRVSMPVPECPNGKAVELRNAIGCLSGYDCAELSN